MKKLISIIAVALAVTVWCVMPAMAAKIDVGGELRARGIYNTNFDSEKDNTKHWLDGRFRLDAKIQQGMTTGVLQIDALGNSNSDLTGTGNNGNLIFGNGTGASYNLVGVRQAYLVVNFPVLTVIGGRYEVKLGNGLVLNDTTDIVAVNAPIGPVNLLVGYLVLGNANSPLGRVSSQGGHGLNGDALAVNAGVKDIGGSGINGDIFGVFAHRVLPTLLPDETPVPDTKDNTLQAYGITGDAKIGPVNAGAEVDIFGGDVTKPVDATGAVKFKGTNILVTGALPAGSVGLPVGFNAAFISATGQDGNSTDVNINAIDGDFRAGNILVRNDFNNYEGVESIGFASGQNLGLTAVKVAANLPNIKFGGSTHSPEIGLVWAQTAKDNPVNNKKDIGTEIYANTNCVFDPNLSGNIGLGYLAAGHALDPSATQKAENQVKVEASLTFHF